VFPETAQSMESRFQAAPTTASGACADAGWYVFQNDQIHVQIVCGNKGKKSSGHAHNDKLSFCLQVGGDDILVDPGTYFYTSNLEARNRFRKTSSHNTVVVDGKEQNPFLPGAHFALPERTRAEVLQWKIDENGFEFEGSHRGYSPILHHRRILYSSSKKVMTIHDRFEGVKKPGKFEIVFQLAPGIQLLQEENAFLIQGQSGNSSLRIVSTAASEIQASEFSPSYGLLLPSRKIVFKREESRDFTHETVILLNS